MNPAAPRPRTGRAHRLVAQGRVERARGQQRVGDPRHGRDELATGPRAATDLLDHLAQRRAQLDLGDPAADGVAADRADDGARRLVGAELPEPVGAVAQDGGDVGEGLDVVGQRRRRHRLAGRARHLDVGGGAGARRGVGLPLEDLVDASPVGRGDAGERRSAVDHLEQRGLLAEQVLLGSGDQRDGHGVGPARGVDLGDGGPQPLGLGRERRLGGDDHRVGADGVGRDQRALEHAVRDRRAGSPGP